MKQTNYYKKFLKIIEDLKHTYPQYNIGRHISTALSDYGDYWGITDKEFCFALEKYKAELELDDLNIASEDFVNKVVEDGKHLFDEKEEEDEDGY